ncbi:MAG TPA: hypothetical protein VFP78_17310 [Solirubrobacteraceae bacterium]|nr:hypothetical protein [Solirubrobacteraceae bacterium]
MPVPPAELTVQLTIDGPDAAKEAGRAAAAPSGVAREAGAETLLAGSRADVLAALSDTLAAALQAGAHAIEVRLETPPESR